MPGQKDDGAINIDRTSRSAFLESIKLQALSPPTTPVIERVERRGDAEVLTILGSGFTPGMVASIGGRAFETTFLNAGELNVETPRAYRDGTRVELTSHSPAPRHSGARSVAPVELEAITPSEYPLRTATPFDLTVSFGSARGAPARLLEMQVRWPDGHDVTEVYELSADDAAAGRKVLRGLSVERGGSIEVLASLYDAKGNADYLESVLPVVPSNPLQLYVYPASGSPSGKGAAEYRSSDDRYYCEGNWVVSNGNDFPVTVGPRVRCRVSDAGLGELADFTFTIGPVTVPANGSRSLYVYTRHGSSSDVYDLFRDFGDAKYEFWLQTSTGSDISDWNVWVAMAQVGVTANFVGNFSDAERLKVVDLIDTVAESIYNKVDCFFSSGTPILEVPSSHSDWSRYRDIRVEESKGKCTDSDEGDDLRDDWSAPSTYNNRIDLFFVESFSGDACASSLGGFSPVDGPTGKGGDDSGIVIDVKDLSILSSTFGATILGVVVAHEVGHYLGLKHSSGSNFMAATVGTGNTSITYGQWKTMRDHGFVRRLNP